ncbi:MAG: CPBP family intramembrane metalloprotease [Clostridia bacterium]|nr:CPBP family intramembrane metalloprotease [Clostridia bacterium]
MEQEQEYNFNPFKLSPKEKEKKNIKKTAMYIAVPLLIIFALNFRWSKNIYDLANLFGISMKSVYNFISEPAVLSLINIVFSVVCFVIIISVSAKIKGERISDLVAFEKPKRGLTLPFLLFGVGFCTFSNIAVSYAGEFFEKFGFNYSVGNETNPKGIFGFLITVFATAFIPALTEEFCFRGIIFGFLKKYGDMFALIASSILFGVMHGNFEQMPFAILVGLVLGLIRIKTGSLWGSIALHFYNNFTSVVFEYAFVGVSDRVQNAFYIIFYSFTLLSGAVSVYLFSKREKDLYKTTYSDTVSTTKQKLSWFFTSPLIILFLVIYIGLSFKYFF